MPVGGKRGRQRAPRELARRIVALDRSVFFCSRARGVESCARARGRVIRARTHRRRSACRRSRTASSPSAPVSARASEEGTVSGRVGGPNRNREKENRTAVREGGTRTRRRGRRRRGLERDERRGANHASARTTRLSVSVVPSPVTGTLQHAPMAAERSRRSQPQDGRTRGLSRTALRSARP
jgi:hypothetical protein